jgi:hypothetical protein
MDHNRFYIQTLRQLRHRPTGGLFRPNHDKGLFPMVWWQVKIDDEGQMIRCPPGEWCTFNTHIRYADAILVKRFVKRKNGKERRK